MSPSRVTEALGLTQEQLQTWDQDGYLIIPDALDSETISSLLNETHSMLNNFSLEDHPMTKFSTGEGSEHVGDDYFLDSGDKVRFFFEEGKYFDSYSIPTPRISRGLGKYFVDIQDLTFQMHSMHKGTSPSQSPKPSTR